MRLVALSLGVRNKDKEASAQESGVVCCLFALSYRRTSTKMEKELLKEKLRKLDTSAKSIESVSRWCKFYRKEYKG